MISQQQFKSMVDQVNAEFDRLKARIEELEKPTPKPKVDKKKKT